MSSAKSENEGIKTGSDYLRGTISEGLLDAPTGALDDRDTQLTKFHGIYQQDDRDLRIERQRQRLEPAFSFMIRARVPGGLCSPDQWLTMERLATRYGNESFRLTTRQAFQLHGVIKRNLKSTIASINEALMDTLAACGDVNRNVMCSPNPEASAVHAEVQAVARAISDHLTPRTTAYHEIWLDRKKVAGAVDEEPIYGRTYLPRKFKIGVAVPPWNDVDVFSQDLGFIAITEQERLLGFNVVVGGGMGTTHGDPETYPRVGDVIGFCAPDQVLAVAEHVVTVQRDFGDRSNRKHARLKYTIADRGVAWFRDQVESRAGLMLGAARGYRFVSNTDRFGWSDGTDGRGHLTLWIPSGRVANTGERPLLAGLHAIAEVLKDNGGGFRLTPNQNVIVAGVSDDARPLVEALARRHGLMPDQAGSELRLRSLACVALPTCGLAMAESERYMPDFLSRLEALLGRHDLEDSPLHVRMTGCPNGCARPFLAEIGLVGKAPGRYNLYLGGDRAGERLNRLVRENADEKEILAVLEPLLSHFSRERIEDEAFGDFLERTEALAAAVGD